MSLHTEQSWLKNQVLITDLAIKKWAAEFEFNSAEVALTNALFKRRLANSSGSMELTPEEVQQVRRIANGGGGLQACRQSLGEVNIILP
jgi:hypothetical protein